MNDPVQTLVELQKRKNAAQASLSEAQATVALLQTALSDLRREEADTWDALVKRVEAEAKGAVNCIMAEVAAPHDGTGAVDLVIGPAALSEEDIRNVLMDNQGRLIKTSGVRPCPCQERY